MVLQLDIDLIPDLHQWFLFHCHFQRLVNSALHQEDMQRGTVTKKSGCQNQRCTEERSNTNPILNGCVSEKSSAEDDEAEAETVSPAAEVTDLVELRVFEAIASVLPAVATEKQ